MRLSQLPARTKFTDVPHRETNFDNGQTRALDVAWNLMLEKDVAEITFKEIAKVAKITPSAIYYHYASPDDLATALCVAAIRKLNIELVEAHPRGRKPLHALGLILNFAKKRPHHFSLVISPRFSADKAVASGRRALDKNIDILLGIVLGRDPRPEESHLTRLHLYGGGTLIALGTASVKDVMTPLAKQIWNWRRDGKKRA